MEIEKLYTEILSNKGNHKHSFNENDFGKYLIPCFAEMLVPLKHSVCRVVQVRKEIGAFGSDLVFVRCQDGTLMPWENQSFFEVRSEYTQDLNNLFAEVNTWDDSEEGKDLGYNYPDNKTNVAGFIIPSPYPADHTTPMKSVKAAIYNRLDKL